MGGYLMDPEGGYAWLVDRDYDHDPKEPYPSRVGTTGPNDAPELLLELLRQGKGRRWRTLYDDDGEGLKARLVHGGRYIDYMDLVPGEHGDVAYTEVDSDAEFGPLHDLSQPDCGACEIQFYDRETRKWVSL